MELSCTVSRLVHSTYRLIGIHIVYYPTLGKMFSNFKVYGIITPEMQVLVPGTRANITCHSRRPAKWYNYLGVEMKDPNVVNNVMIFEPVRWEDAGVYVCRGKTLGGITFKAQSILYVASKLFFIYYNSRVISHCNSGNLAICNNFLALDNSRISPPLLKRYLGVNAIFTCNLNRPIWFYGKPAGKVISTVKVLPLDSISLASGGYYYCYGKLEDSDILARTLLKVYGK